VVVTSRPVVGTDAVSAGSSCGERCGAEDTRLHKMTMICHNDKTLSNSGRRGFDHAIDDPSALDTLFAETVALYLRLSADAVRIHHFGSLSGPRRTVLVGLAQSGPRTVSQMARARAQSRQRFQPLVKRLVADGLVENRPNPAHKLSPLIALTAKGKQVVKEIVARERALQSRFRLATPTHRVKLAAAVLREVRQALEDQMPRLLATTRGRRSS
jgi:DNA-binding MarR family transcriptional regulator